MRKAIHVKMNIAELNDKYTNYAKLNVNYEEGKYD